MAAGLRWPAPHRHLICTPSLPSLGPFPNHPNIRNNLHRRTGEGHSFELKRTPLILQDSCRVAGVNGSNKDKCPDIRWLPLLKEVHGFSKTVRYWNLLFAMWFVSLDATALAKFWLFHMLLTKCCAEGCNKPATHGLHVWLRVGDSFDFTSCYIVPGCEEHNGKSTHYNAKREDCGFTIKHGTIAMKIPPHTSYTDLPAAKPPACGPACGCPSPCGHVLQA